MLGWMLKRGLEGGRDASAGPDDTQVEQPDTPAPIFAARALKSALFGTPARPDTNNTEALPVDKKIEPAASTAVSETQSTVAGTNDEANGDVDAKETRDARDTPGRLPGILLTPGTGTTRRKRVSFGRDVEENDGGNGKKEFRIDRDNRSRPSLFGDVKPASNRHGSRTRTKLSEALENARRQRTGAGKEVPHEKKEPIPRKAEQSSGPSAVDGVTDEEEGLWEEVDEPEWDPDVTVDLNEPHSQSGRYWKSQFQRYQEDAKVEMNKLVKYKQLAKSFAKTKDAEAMDLHAKLQEEKNKVTEMEGRITELAGQIARKRMKGSDRDYQELISELTRQTALAVQYRKQVKELEAMLTSGEVENALQQEEADESVSLGPASRRRQQHLTSPRTQRTIMETQRELRRARDQAKELAQVKEEMRRLKTALREAEKRERKSESASKAMAADLASAEAATKAAEAKVKDLEKRATFAEDERRRRGEELRLLQRKYESLKDDAKARVGEAEQVLRRKNEQIAELKKKAWQAARHPELAIKEDGREEETKAKAAAVLELPLQREVRNRHETRLGKHDLEERWKQHRTNRVGATDDFAIKLDGAHLDAADEPELPQQKTGAGAVHILEDQENESSHFQMPVLRTAAKTGLARSKSIPLHASKGTKDEVVASLRRRRGASPLRTIEQPQTQRPLSMITATTTTAAPVAAVTKRPVSASSDEPNIDLIGSRFARLGETVAKPNREQKQLQQPAAGDTSRASISSERVTAALARVEKRRAERRRALDSLRNKENMEPA